MRVWIVTLIIGLILFVPIFYIEPNLTIDSLTTYYLAGFIFVQVLLFLLERERQRQKEKQDKLIQHYGQIRDFVLGEWRTLTVSGSNHAEGLKKASATLYLDVWRKIDTKSRWSARALEHVWSAEKYSEKSSQNSFYPA
ncbi:MAG: hypothetical protein H3Z51_01560 [archaeon]|nr:hypothetical protein [archaeon]